MRVWLAASLLIGCVAALSISRSQAGNDADDIHKFTVQMIGYSPTQNDDYVAVSRRIAPEGYVVGFEPLANADRVHHMLLYGCTEPAGESFWKGGSICGSGGTYIVYAWARNAPNLVLPRDVAFSVGHQSDNIKYFVLQVHYAQPFAGAVKDFSGVTIHISQRQPKYYAAIMIFSSGEPIPPKRTQAQINMSCEYQSDTEIHPFAFRTHTHAMGRVVSAFNKHNGQWTKIGVRNPQWPQLFEKIPTPLTIVKGDLMAATCRFDSSDKTTDTPMGSMGTNEMCNFYMMFYWDREKENPFPWGAMCGMRDRNQEVQSYPIEGMTLLPPHPELEHHAHQSSIPFGVVEQGSFKSVGDVTLGQVAGLSFDNEGNLIVFHRAGRVWEANTYDQYNVLLDKTPIADDVILFVRVDGNQTSIVKKLGKNKFYMPHSVHMDKDGFLYTTDVGSHTVAKWKVLSNDLELVWENGEKLMPDSDRKHFCKPSGVVRKGDSIFVTDGYCNSRVVELTLDGKRINEFGLPGNGPAQFQLPHDIVATPAGDHLLVADRENGRVQLLGTKGEYVAEWGSRLFNNVYSVDAVDDYVFFVPGRPVDAANPIDVFVGRADTGLVEFAFQPQSGPFGQPHIVRVSPDGRNIFVGDIHPSDGKGMLWAFKVQREGSPASHMAGFMSVIGTNTISSNSFAIVFAATCVFFIGAFVIKKRLQKVHANGASSFDRKGFKPLRTEETVGFISDASDSE